MNEKECSKCRETKPLDVFAVYKGKPWFWCKPCQRAASRAYRKNNPEKIRSQNAAWRKNNAGYSAASSRKWRAENRERHLRTLRERDAKRRATDPTWDFRRNLKKLYGLSVEQYEAMYRAQNGVCAICSGVNVNGRRLAVDHCHKTGAIRGLLCSNCNFAIGLTKDNPDVLAKAISYLAVKV